MDKEKRKARYIRIAVAFVLHLPFTMYCGYIVYQIMYQLTHPSETGLNIKIDFNYLNSIELLMKGNQAFLVSWAAVEFLIIILFFLILIRPVAKLENVEVFKVTDNISIPVPAGNGQYGTAWFADSKDKDRLLNTFVFDGEAGEVKGNLIKGHPGPVCDFETDGTTDRIKYLKSFAHCIILAMTGAGKTRRILLETICLQMLAGECIVASDVKGEIYYSTVNFAKKLGYKKILTFDLINPLKSLHYNFLQPITEAIAEGREEHRKAIRTLQERIKTAAEQNDYETVAALGLENAELENDYSWSGKAQERTWDLVSAMVGEQKGEPLWYNGETATMAACILAICMEAPKPEYWNLYNVYTFVSYMAQEHPILKKTPLTAYLATLLDTHPAKVIFMQSQVAAERTRSSFYTSMMGTLRLFTNPDIAEMTSYSDFNLSDIGKEKSIIYMLIPDEKKTYYPLASLFINQMYLAQVETARKSGGRLPVNTNYDLDEAGNFPTIPSLPQAVAAGRSRGVYVNLVLQDYQQLEKKYKDDEETIKSQCGLKILLKTDSPKTLTEINKKFGNYTTRVTNASVSSTTNVEKDNLNISNGSNLGGRKLLFEDELSKFQTPDALVMITGESPMITNLPDLSKYKFNKMLGLGDEEHNRRISAEIESGRPEREHKQIPLWGIWNVYKKMLEEEAMKINNTTGLKGDKDEN